MFGGNEPPPSRGKRVGGFQAFTDPMNAEKEALQKRQMADYSALRRAGSPPSEFWASEKDVGGLFKVPKLPTSAYDTETTGERSSYIALGKVRRKTEIQSVSSDAPWYKSSSDEDDTAEAHAEGSSTSRRQAAFKNDSDNLRSVLLGTSPPEEDNAHATGRMHITGRPGFLTGPCALRNHHPNMPAQGGNDLIAGHSRPLKSRNAIAAQDRRSENVRVAMQDASFIPKDAPTEDSASAPGGERPGTTASITGRGGRVHLTGRPDQISGTCEVSEGISRLSAR